MGILIVTKDTIRQWIAEGRGQGFAATYQPWIRISTRGMPTKGRHKFFYVPFLNRYFHSLSAGESAYIKLLLYVGVVDLRDQYPLWLWEHYHSLYDHPRFRKNRIWSRGTLAIANELGITLPRYRASKITYTPTTDILATVLDKGTVRVVAFCVKPDPNESPLSVWDAAKLAVQEKYHTEIGDTWKLVSANKVPDTLNNNLEILIRYSERDPKLMLMQNQFGKTLRSCLSENSSLGESLAYTRKKLSIDAEMGNQLFHRCLWFRTVNVDIRHAWVMSMPPTLTEGDWIAKTRNYLFGRE